jgi:hypothetical protein
MRYAFTILLIASALYAQTVVSPKVPPPKDYRGIPYGITSDKTKLEIERVFGQPVIGEGNVLWLDETFLGREAQYSFFCHYDTTGEALFWALHIHVSHFIEPSEVAAAIAEKYGKGVPTVYNNTDTVFRWDWWEKGQRVFSIEVSPLSGGGTLVQFFDVGVADEVERHFRVRAKQRGEF